jgi:hypothetical protein
MASSAASKKEAPSHSGATQDHSTGVRLSSTDRIEHPVAFSRPETVQSLQIPHETPTSSPTPPISSQQHGAGSPPGFQADNPTTALMVDMPSFQRDAGCLSLLLPATRVVDGDATTTETPLSILEDYALHWKLARINTKHYRWSIHESWQGQSL